MLLHMTLEVKENHKYNGITYELAVYRGEGEADLRGYISSGGFSSQIVEMSRETATDMRVVTGNDPVKKLVEIMRNEIDAGKFPIPGNT